MFFMLSIIIFYRIKADKNIDAPKTSIGIDLKMSCVYLIYSVEIELHFRKQKMDV